VTPGVFYLWLKAAHIIAVIAFVGGLLLEAVVLTAAPMVDRGAAAPFVRSARAWDHRVTGPALVLAWGLGLTLALQGAWFPSSWLWAKLALALALSGLHGVQSGALRRLAQGAPATVPRGGGLAGPAILAAVAAVVLLVVLKPR